MAESQGVGEGVRTIAKQVSPSAIEPKLEEAMEKQPLLPHFLSFRVVGIAVAVGVVIALILTLLVSPMVGGLGLLIGFFAWLVTNWHSLTLTVINGFAKLGLQASGGGSIGERSQRQIPIQRFKPGLPSSQGAVPRRRAGEAGGLDGRRLGGGTAILGKKEITRYPQGKYQEAADHAAGHQAMAKDGTGALRPSRLVKEEGIAGPMLHVAPIA